MVDLQIKVHNGQKGAGGCRERAVVGIAVFTLPIVAGYKDV